MATVVNQTPAFVIPVHPTSESFDPALELPGCATLLEKALPFRELSLVAKADRRAIDPVYATHRWWARRPPGVIRALLLASAMTEDTEPEDFWNKFASPRKHLDGYRVHDMFAGGGAMLVEAARLGAIPSGTDVDPLAVDIIRHELNPPEQDSVADAAGELLEHLSTQVGQLFAASTKKWTPLHYFYLHQVTCPKCRSSGVLFRNLVIARDVYKNGGVLRDARQIVFCPDCLRIHGLRRADQQQLRCCGRKHKLNDSTFRKGRYWCPHCGTGSTHRELSTGTAPRMLLAVEETAVNSRRRIRGPRSSDLNQIRLATEFVSANRDKLCIPDHVFTPQRHDGRPVSFGIKNASELFSQRQLAAFSTAFAYLDRMQLPVAVERALRLTLSNALTTNNKLCSYATEYGRLAPLFSVRSYSLPWLAVELNPFHPTAGRGTFPRALRKMLRSTAPVARRYHWSTDKRKPIAKDNEFPRLSVNADVRCISATEPLAGLPPVDICLFDPPYFDYIAYSELSEFYRAWRKDKVLGGDALLPSKSDPSTSFGAQLGKCLKQILAVLKPNRPLAFTFHSLSTDAWRAIGITLDQAALCVTAIWPVLNDAHMGHHGAKGNCEWDLIVVCRRVAECSSATFRGSVDEWASAVKPLRFGEADRTSMEMALRELSVRFGQPRTCRS